MFRHYNHGQSFVFRFGGLTRRARECDPITGLWGRSPQRDPGAEVGSGGEAP